MSSLLADAIAVETTGSQPWPPNVRLFQPYETDQIILPDFASCLSVKAFLKMAALPYQVELRTNAEDMSPSGRVPFIHVGNLLVPEFDRIVSFAQKKGLTLGEFESDDQRADMKAYMALVNSVLLQAELYVCWCEKEVMAEITSKRYGAPYPWPLNRLLPWKRQREVKQQLRSSGWMKKTNKQREEEVRRCCRALSEKLGSQTYFFGNKPSELDALVFGHLYSILTTTLPVSFLSDTVKEFRNLQSFVQYIDDMYFTDFQLNNS